MSLVKKDHQETVDLLLQQWKDKDNIRGIIEASMVQGNKIENALFEIKELMYLDNAEGESLDFIGKIFDVERSGTTDTGYRAAIKLQTGINFSGEPEVIIQSLIALYNATFVEYTPQYPGKYMIFTDADIIRPFLDKLSMAGVNGLLAGYLIDANENNIVDAQGNFILQVAGPENYISGPIGVSEIDTLVDTQDNTIIHIAG